MTKYTYGFLVTEEQWASCDSVVARVKAREPNATHPINKSATSYDDGPMIDSLQIRVWRGDEDSYISDAEPIYAELTYVNARIAKKAHETMHKINKQIAKDGASEPGDMLMAVAKAVGATWYARPVTNHVGQFYSDNEWRFGPVLQARDEFRRCIDKLKAGLVKKDQAA